MGAARLVYEMSRLALCEHDGNVVVIKIPMDESGVHGGSPVLTVAAYLERPAGWRDWTKRWNIAKRPIRVFHAADCANRRGEFEGWDERDRDDLVIRALKVIDDAKLSGVVIGVHLGEFEKAMAGRDDLRVIFGEPYIACFHWVTQAIINTAIEVGSAERLAFVHECNDYRQQALEAFGWIRANANPGNRVVGLQFAGKEDYVPLQAADLRKCFPPSSPSSRHRVQTMTARPESRRRRAGQRPDAVRALRRRGAARAAAVRLADGLRDAGCRCFGRRGRPSAGATLTRCF